MSVRGARAGRADRAVRTAALSVQDLHGFLALRETEPCPALQALADACVEHLDAFRAPPSESGTGAPAPRESDRRSRTRCWSRWGYPYVFDTWFFHMTLTRRLSAEEKQAFLPAAEDYFARAIATRAGSTISACSPSRRLARRSSSAERLTLRG